MNDPGQQAFKPPLPHLPTLPAMPGTQARPWDLGGGVVMTVVLPNKLSKKNIDKLKRYVAALESEASITWDDEDPFES